MTGYYEKFVEDIAKQLGLNKEKEQEFREVCKLYGVDWKMEVKSK